MKRVLIAAAVAVLAATGAQAADMAAKPMYAKAPVPSPMYNWSGVYVGGDVGGEWSRILLSDPVGGGTLSYDQRKSIFTGGAHAGFQHQFGQFVLGIEGSYLAGNNTTSLGVTPSLSIFAPGGTGTGSAQQKDIWSVGGRGGWAFNNWLPYVTGGYARGSHNFYEQSGLGVPTPANFESASIKPDGTYIGAGLEWAPWMNGIVLGVEYRHYQFDSVSTRTIDGRGLLGDTVTFSNLRDDTVMGRLSYKFGPMFGTW
jgi:outer membrane immunogenic protein